MAIAGAARANSEISQARNWAAADFSFVSLPRDTYVAIPGYGDARLNSAYARGYNDTPGTDAEKDAAGAVPW